MKIKLTGRELMALGYDEPEHRDDPEMVVRVVGKTGRRPLPLDDDELARLRWDIGMLARFGADASDMRTATRLAKKVGLDF